uniref:uncharacterized protein LOC120336240 n=1 Tax=Styela clava TaxID=7725 RepID=UPI0019396CA6|nr:uncharacterized protein LOC120336240 [Styela clava]
MYMMMAKITLVLTTLFLLIGQKGYLTRGQNICSENGTSVVINDTQGTIHVPSVEKPENDQTNKPCYWRFEPGTKTFGVELSVNIKEDNQEIVEIDLIDQKYRKASCTEDGGYCLEFYEYEDNTYYGTCIDKWWWLREYCRVNETSENLLKCIPCAGSGSTRLEHEKTYCYDNCGADFMPSNNCNEHPNRKVDAYINYSNPKLNKSFNITYKILPCKGNESHVSAGKESECFSKEDKGASYRGKIAVTKFSIECQRWDDQFPHEHSRTAEKYPFSGLDDNFCRNPDGEDGPWCYTTNDGERWQYCNVPDCSLTTTAAKTTIHTTITQETTVHEKITSLTQETISVHSTETASSQRAATPPTGFAEASDAGKQTGDKTLAIVLPITGAILIILIILLAVIVIKRRRHLNASSSAKTTVNNAYEQTNFDQAETSPEMIDNILYDSQQQNEKIEVENELYGSA